MTQKTIDPFEMTDLDPSVEVLDAPFEQIEFEEDAPAEEQELPEVVETQAEETESTEDYQIDIVGNPIYIIAKKWQEEGKLPEDLEISEQMTEEEFDQAFYRHKESAVIGDLKSKVLDDLMLEEGLTPEAIETAKMLHFGAKQEELAEASVLHTLGTIELDPADAKYEDYVNELGFQFYIRKGFSDEQAKRYVKRDLDEDNLDSIISEYQDFFKGESRKLIQETQAKVEARKEEDKRQRLEQVQFINNSLEKGEIDGVKYTKDQIKEIKRALFDKTELITDTQGNKRYVTLEQKRILENKNSPEKKLKARIDFVFGVDYKKVEEDLVNKAKKSITGELKSLVVVRPKVKPSTTKVVDSDIDIEI